jgi:hypothetical protein
MALHTRLRPDGPSYRNFEVRVLVRLLCIVDSVGLRWPSSTRGRPCSVGSVRTPPGCRRLFYYQ